MDQQPADSPGEKPAEAMQPTILDVNDLSRELPQELPVSERQGVSTAETVPAPVESKEVALPASKAPLPESNESRAGESKDLISLPESKELTPLPDELVATEFPLGQLDAIKPPEKRNSLEGGGSKRNSLELGHAEKRNSVEGTKKRRSVSGSVAMFSNEDCQKLYRGPLVMHKWYNPLEAGPQSPHLDDSKDPIKVTLPFGKVAVGLLPTLKQIHAEIPVPENPASQTWLVFTSVANTDEALARAKIFVVAMYFLLFADLVLLTALFLQSILTTDLQLEDPDVLAFVSTILGVMLGFVAMRRRDTRLLTIFVCVFYIDSLVNLVRLSDIYQFVQFLLQLAVCHTAGQIKNLLGTSWFINNYSQQ